MSNSHVPTSWLLMGALGCLPIKGDTGSSDTPALESIDSGDTADTGAPDCPDPFEAFYDADADGYGDDALVVETCTLEPGYAMQGGDCDDIDPDRHPDAEERCNQADDDCDGDVDEGVVTTSWFADSDADGWGDETDVIEACVPPEGRVTSAGDCNDADSTVHPEATEVCNDIDDNCDGTVDEDAAADAPSWYADMDLDRYGDADTVIASCTAPEDYIADDTDCDDGDATIHPGAEETCNDIDDDCDDAVDEDIEIHTWFPDGDGDGWGTDGAPMYACEGGDGWAESVGDCDDGDPGIHPGATEICNDIDDNCTGIADEGLEFTTLYIDADGDGYGDPDTGREGCVGLAGYTMDNTDCDDTDPYVHPGAGEVMDDGIDNDCDGKIDRL